MRLTAVAAAVGVAALAACTGQPAIRWSRSGIAVPGEVVTMTAADAGLLVGSYSVGAAVRPALTLVSPGGSRAVPAAPAPGYGAQARWTAVAAHGSEVTAVGGIRGGAHGNVRWTEWSGTVNGVRDVPQSFWTFGGHEAGDVVGVAYLDGRPVIVGGWASPRTGFDIASYELQGTQWRRRSPAGPELASTPAELLSAAAVASGPPGLVVVGSTTRLTPDLPVSAVIWTGRRSGSGIAWTRRDLPGPAPAEARSVACDEGECLVAGRAGGHLATWRLRGDTIRAADVEELSVGDVDPVLAPVHSAQGWLVVVRSGAGARAVLGDGTSWAEADLPAGTPTAMAATGGQVWIATVADGRSTLWQATGPER